MTATEPATPPDVLALHKGKTLKPDAQGRLIFRPRGLAGPGYVVDTVEQLKRAEAFHRTKLSLGVITAGAAIGSISTMQGRTIYPARSVASQSC